MLARRFPGGTGQLSVTPVWLAPAQLTLMARVFCSTTAGGTLFSRWEGAPNNSILLSTEGVGMVDTTSTYRLPSSLRPAARNRWCTTFLVVDATTLYYYVDGTISASSAQTGGPINLGSTYRFGSRPEGDQLTGSICDIAFWSEPLNQAEIIALTNGARPGQVRRSSLQAWWPCDAERGQNAERDVLQLHPLTLSGDVTVGAGPDFPILPQTIAASVEQEFSAAAVGVPVISP